MDLGQMPLHSPGMVEKFTFGVHLVRVTTDKMKHQLWAVATEREGAVTLVLNAVPEGWTAVLLPTRLTVEELLVLNMAPGEVRELKE
jgi:hypothetical protein